MDMLVQLQALSCLCAREHVHLQLHVRLHVCWHDHEMLTVQLYVVQKAEGVHESLPAAWCHVMADATVTTVRVCLCD